MKRIVFALLLACASPKKADAPPAAPLVVTLTRANDGNVAFVVENRSASEVKVPEQVLESASLLLEVRDSDGNVVSLGPPPTPDDRQRALAAGAKANGSVHVALPAGKYTARARLSDATSNTVDLVLR